MFNKIILVGNLTRDIELKYSSGGLAIAKTGIATNRKFKKQSGEMVDETMFVDITFFGRSGEVANQYLRKGSKVLIEGRLMLDQWTDQNGQKRSKHSVNVDTMQMLDSKGDAQNAGGGYDNSNRQDSSYTPPPQQQQQRQQESKPAQQQDVPEIDIDEDEIPF